MAFQFACSLKELDSTRGAFPSNAAATAAGLNFVIVQAISYGKIEIVHVIVSALFLCALSVVSALVSLMSAMQTSPAVATRTV